MVKKRVSIEDVAKLAGVSITTVSRVVNKVPTVNKKNAAKVEKAIAQLKFRPNISAQRLARGINNSVGLVMPGFPGIFHSFYAIEIIRGVGHACETLRLDMVFHITDGYNPLTIDVGSMIFADIIENVKQVKEVLEEGVPCMVINNIVHNMDVNYIAVDNVVGGQKATEYLMNLGHKRIATVTGNLQTQAGKDRFEGFQKAVKKHKLEARDEYVIQGDYSRRSARLGAEKLFDLKEPPTAIFAASDEMALELIAFLIERGIKVPEDVSVIGFDDNPAGLYGPVGLTTVKQPLFDMACKSVQYLNDIITEKRKAPIQEVLSPEIIIRESCSRAKG